MNSTNGVTAKFLDLLREKVERKKYELKREEELTVEEVRKWVISSETGSANRAFVHLTRSVFPKEERAELVETGTADALVLHSSWSETGLVTSAGLGDLVSLLDHNLLSFWYQNLKS